MKPKINAGMAERLMRQTADLFFGSSTLSPCTTFNEYFFSPKNKHFYLYRQNVKALNQNVVIYKAVVKPQAMLVQAPEDDNENL
jgi:hypothetical protein